MKWFIIPAAAAFGLVVATPALATSGPSSAQPTAQPAQTTMQLAQRHDRDRDRDRVRDRRHRDDRIDRRNRHDWDRYRPGHRPPAWERQHRHFNPGHWQRNYHADRRYRWGHYRRPPGWYYRRWVYGATLPTIFWGRDYWINSYWNYGLIDPPYGYVWVRYGGDAILVNVHTGVVLRVVYDVFY